MKNRVIWLYVIVTTVLILAILWSLLSGSISITFWEIATQLFSSGNENVAIIRDLRLPRIILALFAGAALSVSGLLLQAVLKNPLADAGVIGISAGAQLFVLSLLTFSPQMYNWSPVAAFIGGSIACVLVFLFSIRSGLNPLYLIIIGVAVNAVFTGLGDLVSGIGAQVSSQASGSAIGFGMKKWSDVSMLVGYGGLGLLLSFFLAKRCNLLALTDDVLVGLGAPIARIRIMIAAVAVLLAAVATAVVGVIAFVGLLVPHMSRSLLKTADHRILLPFSMLLGGLLLIIADTLGRIMFEQVEIPAAIIMLIIGGPFLILLMWRNKVIR